MDHDDAASSSSYETASEAEVLADEWEEVEEQQHPDAVAPLDQAAAGDAAEGDPPEASSAAAAAADPVADPVRDAGLMQHGCEHYRRRCKLVAPCCGEVFWCRHCHNQAKDDGEQNQLKRHTLDRKLVTEVMCALCSTRQPVGEACRECGVQFGRYSCSICNFYDDDVAKRQYHCDACGICRVGGRDNFFHCATCNCCYSVQLRATHQCVANAMHQNCPVCFEFLFDSVRPIAVLPCGHTLHQECLRNMLSHQTLTCPLCMKCCVNSTDRGRLWEHMDQAVASTPMPREYQDMDVDVLCNDCGQRSSCRFHVLGHKCGACGGYNTRRV